MYGVIWDGGGGYCVDVLSTHETAEEAIEAAERRGGRVYPAMLTQAAIEDMERGLRPYRAAVRKLDWPPA